MIKFPFFGKKDTNAPKDGSLIKGKVINEDSSQVKKAPDISFLDGMDDVMPEMRIVTHMVNGSPVKGSERSIATNSFLPFPFRGDSWQEQEPLDKINCMMQYPNWISYSEIEWLYSRNPIANRVCNAYPEACWNPRPMVLEIDNTSGVPETEFEKVCAEIADKVKLYTYMQRVDVAAQKGQYAVMYISYNDKNLHSAAEMARSGDKTRIVGNAKEVWDEGFVNPGTGEKTKLEKAPDYLPGLDTVDWASLKGKGADAINMVVIYEQANAWPTRFVVDYAQPCFSLVSAYNLQSGGNVFGGGGSSSSIVYGSALPVTWNVVSASRCIHVIDHNVSNNILGLPLIYPIFNDLINVLRVTGGSSMAFQYNCRGGLALSIDTKDGQSASPADKDSFIRQIKKYLSGFGRVLFNQNFTVQPINHESTSPVEYYDTYLKNIAMSTKIPVKILTGSESGKLASEEDGVSFARHVKMRQEGTCTDWIKQFFDPLIAHGVIPAPKNGTYKIEWPKLDIPDNAVQADNFNKCLTGLAAAASAPSPDVENAMQDFVDQACKITGIDRNKVDLQTVPRAYLSPDTRAEDMVEVFGIDQIGSR